MRIVVLSHAGVHAPTNQSLVLAAERRGHSVAIVPYAHTILDLDDGRPLVRYGGEAVVADAVIPRVVDRPRPIGPPFGFAVIRHFELAGVPVLTSARSAETARDKWSTLQSLAEAGVAVPRSSLLAYPPAAKWVCGENASPVVVKPQCGAGGHDIVLAQSEAEVAKRIPNLEAVLVEDFYGEAGGHDLRLLILESQVIAVAERTAQAGDFRANVGQGGAIRATEVGREIEYLAVAAARALDLAFAGVDIIVTNSGPVVMEVNAFPQFSGIEAATGVHVAQYLIKYVEKIVNRSGP